MDNQDINGAWSSIAPWVSDSHRIDDPNILKRVLVAFAEVAEEKYGSSLAVPAQEAADAPDNPECLYHLGYQLQEKNLPSLSFGILHRAHAIAPDRVSILTELVSALEQQGRYQEAYTLLEQAPAGTLDRFMPAYLLVFNSVAIDNLSRARDLLPQLLEAEAPEEVFMASRIKKMLSRADALDEQMPSELSSSRGKHYIRYGSLLLGVSDTGEPVRGHDTYSRIYQTLLRLKFAIDTWQLVPKQILSLPDPASRGIAQAIASFWDISCNDWFGSSSEGLIVAYDLKNTIAELRDSLLNKIAGQELFVYLAGVGEQRVCPDFLGSRYSEYIPVWEEARDPSEFSIFDEPESTDPDPEQIKQSVIEAGSDLSELSDSEFSRMVEFMSAIEVPDALPMARQDSGRREPLWVHPQE